MINRCIGCYYHDSKENSCTHGSPIFLDDTCTEYQADDFVKQIREDAIDEELQNFAQWLWDSHYLVDEAFTIRLVEQYKAEQLKEQKKCIE